MMYRISRGKIDKAGFENIKARGVQSGMERE